MADEKSGESTRASRTHMERTSDTELVMSRTFRAPAHVVFDAWTQPELVKRWWAPASHGVTVAECTAEVRAGGRYRYVLARGADERMAFSGKYIEVLRPTRLVYTQSFEPVPGEAVITVSFEEQGGTTKLVAHEVYPTKEALDGAIQSGMEDGAKETMDQLDELVSARKD
jgi:uncharacterized protein YndB with AHSA1/START domain